MKNKKIVPFLALILLVILVIVGIVRIENKNNKKNNEAVLVEEKEKGFDIDFSTSNSDLQTVSHYGVSFQCPASWDVQRKVSAQGQVYELTCDDSTNANRTVHFMWMNMEISPEVWIKDGLKEAEDNLKGEKITTSSIKNYEFNTIKSKTVDFSYTQSDTKGFGKITSFNIKDGSCIVIMFNDSEIVNDADFYAIEKSFVVK